MAPSTSSVVWKSIEAILVIGFSIFAMLSRSPLLGGVSNYLTIAYYIFVPGYALTSLLAEEYDLLSRAFYSILIGLVLLLSLSALEQDSFLQIPTDYALTIPIIAIIAETYVLYFRNKR